MEQSSHEIVKNNQRIDAYKKKVCVSDIEAYKYIRTMLCDFWKRLDAKELITELEELLPFMSERVKSEIRTLIGTVAIRDSLKLHHCRMCKKPVWLPADQEVHVLGLICSEKCEEEYEGMRRDGHWR